MRLQGKTAIIVGNGRATCLRFAQEGAKVMAVDRELALAEETAALVRKEGGDCFAFEADVTREAAMAAMVAEATKRWGRVDILHYNVGVSLGGGDAQLGEITEEAFDRVMAINLRGAVMAAKHALPVMRAQKSGVILMISSLAAIENYPYVAYKTSKAAMVAFVKQ